MTFREQIIDYMKDPRFACRGWYPTWRFKFRLVQHDTPEIRRELDRMKRDGLVASDNSQRNNTMWQLTTQAPTS
ncbi:hypothetical protein D3C85_883020 [compost metagenome]